MTLLNDTAAPTIAPAERAARLTEAGSLWGGRIASDVSAAQLSYRVSGVGAGSVATTIRAGKHQFIVDEPAALAGDDVAASPVEFALGALVSCQVVVYRLYAQALGIVVDDIAIDATGQLDARTLFGIEGGPRAGFTSIDLAITITGPETEERYNELRAAVDAHCPVLDLFANPTPVTASLRKG